LAADDCSAWTAGFPESYCPSGNPNLKRGAEVLPNLKAVACEGFSAELKPEIKQQPS